MVKDHRSPNANCNHTVLVGIARASVNSRALARLVVLFLLVNTGCQSVVDPGRSLRPVQPAAPPPVMAPSGPAFPSNSVPEGPSAIERQPATAVLQLPRTNAKDAVYHTIKSGDTWSSVAKQYGLTVSALTEANGIDASTVLQPGEMIYIPES